jgi:hypothetical protein
VYRLLILFMALISILVGRAIYPRPKKMSTQHTRLRRPHKTLKVRLMELRTRMTHGTVSPLTRLRQLSEIKRSTNSAENCRWCHLTRLVGDLQPYISSGLRQVGREDRTGSAADAVTLGGVEVALCWVFSRWCATSSCLFDEC